MECTSPQPPAREFDAIVIGGGISGLTCAVGLAERLRVLVLERAPVLGGRARSVVDEATGHSLPIGPHVFLENYANVLSFLERLGTRERIVWDERPHLTVSDGSRAFEAALDSVPPPLHFWPALFNRPGISPREIASNLPALLFALQLDERDVLRLDDFRASEVLGWLGVREPSLTTLWSFMAQAILNVPLDECSAGALFRFCGFLLSRHAPRFGFADTGLGDVYAPAARQYIERRGGQINVNSHVTEILRHDGRVCGVRLADGTSHFARFVVAALPADALLATLPETLVREPTFAELGRFEASPYVSVFLWFDHKLTRRKFWARSYDSRDFGCDFYDLSNVYRGFAAEPSLIAANIIHSHRVHALDDAVIAERIRAEVAEFLPTAREEHVVRYRVQRIPLAIHCPHVGVERLRPETQSPLPGLLLAGDWVRTQLPSSMESAARSGWLAAERVLEEIGRPQALAQPAAPIAAIPHVYRRAVSLLPVR
ncbi:MAG TPA: FAD-dependent oxidoreductase, partial [Polyangiaceae bacterium]|nr:FAD-dependent oxidoreductase [Polyangiaceae bacterium]